MGYNISLLNEKHLGGLTRPSGTMVFFCGSCLDVTRKMLEEEKFLNEFYSASAYVRAGAKDVKHYMIVFFNNSSFLMDFHEVCEGCNRSRKNTIIEKCLGKISRAEMSDLTKFLNKKRTQQTITLSTIKRNRKKKH